ncbi:RNA-directed DNA polymerase [bacterium]|nr:RNA-directed DNA polymerase [bacterium]
MKRVGYLFPEIINYENLWLAARRASKGKKNKKVVAEFNFRLPENLITLQQELANQKYQCSDYFIFQIFDPKNRWIVVSDFRDRVVQHALCNVVVPYFERKFIFDSYANRKGKGTHRGVLRYQQFSRRFGYVLNCDIVKFFPSIDRDVMKKKIAGTIKCKPTLSLCHRIIDSAPSGDHVSYFPDGFSIRRNTGLPIGNLTSQHFCNVYLNEFDHFVKEELKCRGYVRYVDDFALFSNSKQELTEWKGAVSDYLKTLFLVLHRGKTQIRPSHLGNTFLGYQIFRDRLKIDNKKGRLWIKRMKYKRKRYKEGTITWQDIKASTMSWVGHTSHANADSLVRKVLWDLVF